MADRTFEIERGSLPRISLEPSAMLAPTPFINSDDTAIRASLPRILGSRTDARDRVDALMRWVNANMRKAPAFSVPMASDVFKRRVGDCNEHAVLFAAMARAAGIPCAIASGMVYSDDHFYYHAWNVVFVDGRWTDVDATFGQFPADATHIILAVGDITDGIEVLQFVRKAKIRILESR
jgi:transglutaminase-like putative cysteine protease